jgi:RNA polymerase sigma-70 factor (ECF subfamily)
MADQPSRLSGIETLWSVVRRAHGDTTVVVRPAQEQLLARYGGAVQRYLRACLRGEDAAAEVFQEFALRFVRGDFRHADPARGRFRDFVKTALRHLVVDYHRAQAQWH